MLFELLYGGFSPAALVTFLIWAAALVIAITVHEFSHALVSDRLGDPTARLAGRLTLNPLAHLDFLGTLFILIARFGWGKPVPFNPYNLQNPQRDSALISIAGPTANILTAVIFAVPFWLANIFDSPALFTAAIILQPITLLNLYLAFFNILPIQPLDGFKIVSGILPRNLIPLWEQTGQLGLFFLIFLILPFGGTSFLGAMLGPVVSVFLRILYLGF